MKGALLFGIGALAGVLTLPSSAAEAERHLLKW